MRNATIIRTVKNMMKTEIAKCTEGEQMLFKRMYSHKNLELPIDQVIDNMEGDKLDHAFDQIEKTNIKNNR